MSHKVIATEAILFCSGYGVLSILQTLNSRYLYKNLQFDYYAFIFSIQKIINIIVFYALGFRSFDTKHLIHILPFAAFMCLSNVISSYCLTIMPLAAFMAFKKFIILFVLVVSLILQLPAKLNKMQYMCMAAIVIGGIMVGQKDILRGQAIGYIASLAFNLFQSLTLIYAAYLYRQKGISPQDLLMYNSVISLPYYLGILMYEGQIPVISEYLYNRTTFTYIFIMAASVFLACTSQIAANYITMKISPFEKAIVSNIKDLILVFISVEWLYDFSITMLSGTGMILCLMGSAIFSVPYLSKSQGEKREDSEEQKKLRIEKEGHQNDSLLQNNEEIDVVRPEEEAKKSEDQE